MKNIALPAGIAAVVAVGAAIWAACSQSDSGRPSTTGGGTSSGSVLQYHRSASRDGLYVDGAFTKAAAAKIHMDTTFKATIEGPTFAQPLYFEGGPGGKNVIIAATEKNLVYALDATTGAEVWRRKVAGDPQDEPVPRAQMPCGGEIDPFGITGTPVIDAATRTIFLDAMTSADGGATKKHKIFALSLDDGATRAGWPVDVSTLKSGATSFHSQYQSQRAAPTLVGGTLYVPYGGLNGDCGDYHGWVIAVPVDNPAAPAVYATTAQLSGIWGPGGIASDGTSIFVTTGNAPGGAAWGHQEAVLRLGAGAPSAGKPSIGSRRPIGKRSTRPTPISADRVRSSSTCRAPRRRRSSSRSAKMASSICSTAQTSAASAKATGRRAKVWRARRSRRTPSSKPRPPTRRRRGRTSCCGRRASAAPPAKAAILTAVKISAGSPPVPSVAWCARQGGAGSPMVTTTDGHADAVVWTLATGGTTRLLAFDGDTGAPVFNGGAAGDAMMSASRFVTPIAAGGRIFVAADSAVHAFTMQ